MAACFAEHLDEVHLHHNRHGASRVAQLRARSTTETSAPEPLLLWRMQGTELELRCVAIETRFGYALTLRLAGETILSELQKTVEQLAAKAARIEAWLLTQGWSPIADD